MLSGAVISTETAEPLAAEDVVGGAGPPGLLFGLSLGSAFVVGVGIALTHLVRETRRHE